jgi:hypothetical protein
MIDVESTRLEDGCVALDDVRDDALILCDELAGPEAHVAKSLYGKRFACDARLRIAYFLEKSWSLKQLADGIVHAEPS